eukprot:COSAG01_NODE_23480_length_813_cov_4.030812_1_plen_155_part_10
MFGGVDALAEGVPPPEEPACGDADSGEQQQQRQQGRGQGSGVLAPDDPFAELEALMSGGGTVGGALGPTTQEARAAKAAQSELAALLGLAQPEPEPEPELEPEPPAFAGVTRRVTLDGAVYTVDEESALVFDQDDLEVGVWDAAAQTVLLGDYDS